MYILYGLALWLGCIITTTEAKQRLWQLSANSSTDYVYRIDCGDVSSTRQILPVSAYYGNQTGCQDPKAATIFIDRCMNKPSCEVQMANFEICGDEADMLLTLEFYCVEPSSFVEICGKGNNNITIQLDGASSDMFIISPNFPLNYPSGQTCQLNLQINGSLELHLLYMDLQHRTTGGTTDLGCYDYVRIWEYDNRAPSIVEYCGKYGSGVIEGEITRWQQPDIFSGGVHAKLKTDAISNRKGFMFWVEGAAEDVCSEVLCGPLRVCNVNGGGMTDCDCVSGLQGRLCNYDPLATTTAKTTTETTTVKTTKGKVITTPTTKPPTTTATTPKATTKLTTAKTTEKAAVKTTKRLLPGDERVDEPTTTKTTTPVITSRPPDCRDKDCEYGACVMGDYPRCVCTPGYIGTLCDVIDPCDGYSCGHGYCAVNSKNEAVCKCNTGYKGLYCSTKTSASAVSRLSILLLSCSILLTAYITW